MENNFCSFIIMVFGFIVNHFKDILECIAYIVAPIGLILTYCEYKKSNKIKRASYIDELSKRLEDDKDIREITYMFQYGDFEYYESFHEDHIFESKVDKTLDFYSYICYLKFNKIITPNEFLFFEIWISHALRSNDVKAYLYHLYHYECDRGGFDPQKDGKNKCSYRYLIKYGSEIKAIDENFYKKGSLYKEKNYLNYK